MTYLGKCFYFLLEEPGFQYRNRQIEVGNEGLRTSLAVRVNPSLELEVRVIQL